MGRLHKLLSAYPGTVTLAEVSSEEGAYRRCAEYTDGDAHRLDMAYSLALMKEPLAAARLREVLSEVEPAIAKGCICWAFSNHDVARAVTRWAKGGRSERLPLALMALLLTLPGAACLYQGEELGLTEAEIEHADMRDLMASPSTRSSSAATTRARRCRGRKVTRWPALPPRRGLGCRCRWNTGCARRTRKCTTMSRC